jgi:hypothetical protein
MNTDRETTENEDLHRNLVETLEIEAEGGDGHVDYSHYSKTDLVQLVENLLKEPDYKKTDSMLKHIKPVFDDIKEHDRSEALEKFIAEGGEKDDFEYKYDELTQRFENAYRQLKERKSRFLQDQEKEKEKNLTAKMALLERLRNLTDADETNASIAELKEIQQEWKKLGPVPAAQTRELWANYNALIERFYSNRSIYFELKELDRKKNLTLKQEICEKAEKLAEREASSQLIRELNDLHEEYKHVGPVPKEDQEILWQRFKATSDLIYNKRKEQLDSIKKEMDSNLAVKNALCEEAEVFAHFNSDKIADWNEKTRDILELQKKWEAAGVLSRDKAKEINKRFWAAFKGFFHHKNEFFRKIEAFREENLRLKTELCEQVEALKESEDFEDTAEKIKKLQLAWKEIGPVPEKFRNQIFDRFKQACDAFFDRRRNQRSQVDREFETNFAIKSEICEKLEKLAAEKSADMAAFDALRDQWENTGFVPKKNLHAIQKRYADAVQSFLQMNPQLTDTEKDKFKLKAELTASKSNPKAYKEIQKKEMNLRRKISHLENDISLWKNNLEFFAHSKTADKLRSEFQGKIEQAERDLESVKKQLQMIYEL